MHTTLQKMYTPTISDGSLSVCISYPENDAGDGDYAALACWTLRQKFRHAYPVSDENMRDEDQGIQMSFLHSSELSRGTSMINIDLNALGSEADQLVFVVNDLDGFLDFDQSDTFFEIWHNQSQVARIPFDLSTIGSEGSLILAVFDRYKMTWGFPGVAVHDVDLVMHDLEYGDLPTTFTYEIDSDFPSALGLQGPEKMGDTELFHALKWAPEGFLQKVKPCHLDRISHKQGEEILTHYREDLSNEDIIPARKKLMTTLIKMGVDWSASISEETGQMPHLADKIDELIRVAHLHKSWAGVVSKTLPSKDLVAYAKTAKMKADYLYTLVPRRCLLEFVSDAMRAEILEQDLGL